MEEPPKDERLIEEIRQLRLDIGRWVRNGLWVFAASVVLVCLTFGPELPRNMKEGIGLLIALFGLLYFVGLVFHVFFNFLRRKRHERESFALLSGRVPAARRRAPSTTP
jgi:lipopolysaccharide export LptBFGC system permease protein LptF